MDTKEAERLAGEWLTAKAALATQQAVVDAIGEQIAALLGTRTEGSQTHKTGHFAITVTGRLNYSCVDIGAVQAVMPDAIRPTLNESVIKRLRAELPTEYARIAPYLTVKPGKPGVAIKLLEVA